MLDWTRNLRIRQLRMLLRLAEVGNLSQVAEEFNLTQPALSKWLKDFEFTIGTELFIRQSRGLQALPIALELAKQARDILSRLDRVQYSINQMKQLAHTQISVGVSPIATQTILPEAVTTFHRQHPKTFIQLQESTADRLFTQLQNGEIDLIIGRIEKNASLAHFRHYALTEITLCLAVDTQHPLANKPEVSWQEVMSYPWIAPPATSPIRQQMDLVFQQLALGPPPVLIESAFVGLTTALLKGTTLIAPIATQLLEPLGLIHRLRTPDFHQGLEASISILWRPEDDESELIQQFIQCVKNAFRSTNA